MKKVSRKLSLASYFHENKSFKAVLRKCWVKYVASVVESFPDGNSSNSKIPVPTRQQMIDWVKEGNDYLAQDKEMVRRSFEVCGITSSDPEKVRSGEFFRKCMGKAQDSLDADKDDEEGDPFA